MERYLSSFIFICTAYILITIYDSNFRVKNINRHVDVKRLKKFNGTLIKQSTTKPSWLDGSSKEVYVRSVYVDNENSELVTIIAMCKSNLLQKKVIRDLNCIAHDIKAQPTIRIITETHPKR